VFKLVALFSLDWLADAGLTIFPPGTNKERRSADRRFFINALGARVYSNRIPTQ
jgi:hypothetical protein